jgi:drug/metabolite transporter (DMT)-like permease
MPIEAVLLVIIVAVLHTGWHFILKNVGERQIFSWWTLAVGCLFYVPLIVKGLPIPVKAWPYLLGSAAVEVIYFVALVKAYEHLDFSFVYPLARGAAPAMIAVWAMVFLGERPHAGGITGLAILVLGLTVVGGAGIWTASSFKKLTAGGVGAALLISFWISIYSVIDGAAMRVMAPDAYASLVLALTAVLLTPVIFLSHRPKQILEVWKSYRGRIFAAAVFMLAAFILVLEAYKLARVSYVAATREVSVILGALAGWHWLHEEFGAIRTIGAVLIFAGIVVIAVAG